MLIKIPQRHLNKVVVGGSLAALLYSYENNIPLIINKVQKPHGFEKEGWLSRAENNLYKWHNLYYLLSNAGLNLLGTKAQHVRIKEGDISVTTKDARVIKFDYNNVILFDDENVAGLPLPTKENKDFVVLDWIISKSCQTHPNTFWETEDNFVKEVHFYPSDRIDGHHPNRKDIVAVSYLQKEQLEDFEYSDTYAKFKVMAMMKEAGIGGRKCGGNNQYALNLEVTKREIMKAAMHTYENTDKLEFK